MISCEELPRGHDFFVEYSSRGSKLTPALALALRILRDVITRAPPRSISVWRRPKKPIIAYSDASWPDDNDGDKAVKEARIGWVLFVPDRKPMGFSLKVNESITANLAPRKQQILAVESFAALAAFHTSPDVFEGEDVVWFVDNEAAVSSLIRGGARPEDIDKIAALTTIASNAASTRVWWEWIDSDSNPSDGLSRDGLSDEWTGKQEWDCEDLGDRDWSHLFRELSSADFDW